MPFMEKPPLLSGRQQDDMNAMRDYLFRMAQSINEIIPANNAEQTAVVHSRDGSGRNVISPAAGGGDADLETVRKNARELRQLILKSAENLQNEIDGIRFSTFYIKYADDFGGDYPETMYNAPKESTYYMGVCSSTSQTAPEDPAVYSWSRIKGDGGTGLNSATVFLYRRANTPPPKPKAALTYTFASGRIDLGNAAVSGHKLIDADMTVTGTHKVTLNTAEVERHLASVTGWTQEIPDSDGRPCWVITAAAIATTATDEILPTEWSEVKKLVEDGDRGQDGQPGQDGARGLDGKDGKNGYNTCIVYLYKRSATAAEKDWSEALTYSFTEKMLTSVPDGWSRTPPAGSDPLYISAATALSLTDTDEIEAGEWTAPVLFVQDGERGIPGPKGENGQTTYLHIKYSNDGRTFTDNGGEDLGAYIGTYTDYNEQDSSDFDAYRWHRFSDDTEMKELIQESQRYVISYVDQKSEEYNGLYMAKTDFGTFEETLNARIETSARGVVESYNYGSALQSVQDSMALVQDYFTRVNGEIRRGIVEDPETHEYVLGIAISQSLQLSGEVYHNDEDGYDYYYMLDNQTFGLYTSTGWQFWINGTKRGWFDSTDEMLHVRNIIAEDTLGIGPDWQLRAIHSAGELEILYVGE